MRKMMLALVALLGTSAAVGASVTIHNGSSWAFFQLFISPVNQESWGPDLLGNQVVPSGESVHISGDCDTYDIKLVDEDGDECVVTDVDICSSGETWTVDDEDLLACQVLTEE